jgi:hypothetical protein
VDRGLLAEDPLQLAGLHAGDPRRVEPAEPALQLERPGERLRDGDLLVEGEADQQRERVAGDQRVGLVVAREVEVSGLVRRRHLDIASSFNPRGGAT